MSALRIAILQTPAPDFSRAGESWSELLARIDDAAQDGPHLVVLPEASYPAWFLGQAASAPPDIPDERIVADLSERARRHSIYIAAGLVLGRPATPQNAAVLIAPDGTEVARAAESQPASWFRPGAGPAATTVQGIDVALFAGADHLDPRWVEALADTRTGLVVATGAARGWTARGHGERDGVHTVGDPVESILIARAIETGAWFAVAGRVGVEGDAVGYAGGAGIVIPGQGWTVRAPADRPGIVLHECDIAPAQPAAQPMPIASGASLAAGSDGRRVHVAALALDPSPSAVDLMEAVRASVRAAAMLGARVVVLPDLTGADPRAVTTAETLPLIETVSRETHTVVISAAAEREAGAVHRTVAVVEDGRLLVAHRQSILSAADRAAGFVPGESAPPVVETATAGRIGVLAGREGLSPATAAGLRQHGASAIAWCAGHEERMLGAVVQTRAWEQRLPVVAAGATSTGSAIAGSHGELLAVSRRDVAMLAHADIAI